MGIIDYLLMVIVVGGAVYLLYHSIWKKKGQCCGSGCGTGSCQSGSPDECGDGGVSAARPAPDDRDAIQGRRPRR
ncbi:MAG: FeoB-associated Cys-rich membrane protein [Thermoleophilia bacterium]